MGYILSWIGVAEPHKRKVLDALKLKDSGKKEEALESEYDAIETARHYIVIEEGRDNIITRASTLARLSNAFDVVSCFVDERTMRSRASLWSAGVERWSVFHDAQESVYHLEITGHIPDILEPIKQRLFKEQDQNGG